MLICTVFCIPWEKSIGNGVLNIFGSGRPGPGCYYCILSGWGMVILCTYYEARSFAWLCVQKPAVDGIMPVDTVQA